MAAVGVRPNIRIEIQNTTANEPMEIDKEEKEPEGDIEDGEISDKNDPVYETESNKLLSSEYAHQLASMGTENGFPADEIPKLLESLGITTDNEDIVRFDALHMKGTGNMVLDDIFKYFRNYEPRFVEWISSECCNVIFQDNVIAAKALYFTSKVIKGHPDESESGRSVLLKNEREVELQGEDMVVLSNNDDDTINAFDVPAPIPEGHWRLGIDHPKTKCVFLRFAFKTDRKQPRVEENNFGGVGLISESRKRKIRGIFDRNRDINSRTDEQAIAKNPWGDLAENWFTNESIEEPRVINFKPVVTQQVAESLKYDVLNRLGIKRESETSFGSDQENRKKSKMPRMRMYADDEEVKIQRKKRLEVVKMFTAFAEDRTQMIPDLRNVIRTANRTKKASESDHHSDDGDLGKTLKNRLKKRNYRNSRLENERKLSPYREEIRLQALQTQKRDEARKAKENNKQIRERERQLDNFRNKSPPPQKNHTESRHKIESSSLRNNSSRHSYSVSKYKNKMHSDRHESGAHRRQRQSRSKENYRSNKPKSKVEVVSKTSSKPTVASTVWSRIDNKKKERLKTASERLQNKAASSESSSESSSSSSSTTSSSSLSDSSSESEDTNDEVVEQATQAILKTIDRPGFQSSSTQSMPVNSYKKSPLRIEISNDHFRK